MLRKRTADTIQVLWGSIRAALRGERGEAELAEISWSTIVWILVAGGVVTCFWVGKSAAAAIGSHYTNSGGATALYERMTSEANTALSITVPANDVNGDSNADGHEVAYFARSAVGGPLGKGEDLFWGYVWSSTTNSVQEYTWTWNGTGFTAPVAKGAAIPNITKFVGVIVPETTRANASSPYYEPVVASASNVQDISCSYGFTEYPGSNRSIDLQIAAGPKGRDGTISTALGQPNIPCMNGHSYIVGFTRATPSPCPFSWTGTPPACAAPVIPTPSPAPTPTQSNLIPLYVCDTHSPARPYGTDIGPDPDGIHEDISNGTVCGPCAPDAAGYCFYGHGTTGDGTAAYDVYGSQCGLMLTGESSFSIYYAGDGTSSGFSTSWQYDNGVPGCKQYAPYPTASFPDQTLTNAINDQIAVDYEYDGASPCTTEAICEYDYGWTP